MKNLATIFCLSLLSMGVLRAQGISGQWYGQADLGGITLRIIFDLQPQGDGYRGTMQSPDQSKQLIPLSSAAFLEGELSVQVAALGFTYTGKRVSADRIEGSFTQNGASFRLNLSREEPVQNRPQEPGPDRPYCAEEVVFRNEEAGIELAGTLTLPDGAGPFPAVVLVTGSGPQDRDETVAGHKPFWVIADFLTHQGIAVLRYDDRGVGASGGDYSSASICDFASDASAAIRYLRSLQQIAPAQVGLIGHSEGGCIAWILAAGQEVDFVISLAGPGIPGTELMALQRAGIFRRSGMSEEFITEYNWIMGQAETLAIQATDPTHFEVALTELFHGTSLEGDLPAALQQFSSPELISLLAFTPASYFSRIECPVLALNGEKDLQVPPYENLDAIEEGMAGHPDVMVKVYPDLNHLFQTARTGLPAEYAHIEETFHPAVMQDMAEWILQRTRPH